jgi:Tfp pilus assembly PilM family ATPase
MLCSIERSVQAWCSDSKMKEMIAMWTTGGHADLRHDIHLGWLEV